MYIHGYRTVGTNDLSLVFGTFLFLFSLPSLVNAWAEGRPPRLGGLMSIGGLGLIIFALTRQTYSLDSLPAVFSRVFRYLMS